MFTKRLNIFIYKYIFIRWVKGWVIFEWFEFKFLWEKTLKVIFKDIFYVNRP